MSLFAGLPRPAEMIQSGKPEISKFKQAENIHLFNGAFYLCYQKGLSTGLKNGILALIVEASLRNISTPSAVSGCIHDEEKSSVGGWARQKAM